MRVGSKSSTGPANAGMRADVDCGEPHDFYEVPSIARRIQSSRRKDGSKGGRSLPLDSPPHELRRYLQQRLFCFQN